MMSNHTCTDQTQISACAAPRMSHTLRCFACLCHGSFKLLTCRLALLQHQLSNMLTLHVRSRAFPTLEDAAQFIKAIIGMYDVYMENKRLKAAVAVANLIEVDSTAAAAKVAAAAAAQHADVTVSTSLAMQVHIQQVGMQQCLAGSFT